MTAQSAHDADVPIAAPAGKPKRKRRVFASLLIGAGAVVLALAGCASAQSVKPAAAGQPAAAASSSQPAPAPAPKPKPLRVRVHFIVTGTGTPSITYGSDTDNISPPGGLGILEDGVALPFRGVMKYRRSADYYAMDAQLETGGSITCKLVITARGHVPLTIATGHAVGDSNICSVQATADNGNGLSWTKE